MFQRRTHRHSLFCILSPDILASIVRNGTQQQRMAALHTLQTDQTFRAMRAADALTVPARRRGATFPIVEGHPQRAIYDAHNTTNLPGDIVRTEGTDPTGDPAVDEAYDGLGASYDFFWEVYTRSSIDDEGMPLNATVHYGQNYDNAIWTGDRLVFGDGGSGLFNRFTIALDVVGHELTHGVTDDEAGLIYLNQPGALSESLSDVFGSLVKQFKLQQTADQADWLVGAGLFTQQVHGVALRSMKAPGTAFDDPVLGKDPQPGHMSGYVHTHKDNGGVHTNSGIPNHAFYLASKKLGGYAWEKAGRIWYEALRDSHLRRTSGFQAFANLTVANADRLYGHNSPERQAVKEAWSEVGIKVSR